MRTKLFCLLLLSATLVFAADPAVKEDPSWLLGIKDKPVLLQKPGMDRVQVQRNIVYRSMEGASLALDLYLPEHASKDSSLPVVILIHGGALPQNLKTTPKEWAVYKTYGRLLAASGFAAVTFDHRFYDYRSLDLPQSDIDEVIAKVRANAGQWGINPNRIFLWAFSGGGIFLSKYLQHPQPYLVALLSSYGVLDLEPLQKETPDEIPDDSVSRFSPARTIDSSFHIPILVIRAGLDDPSLAAGTEHFIHEALSKNVNLNLINYPEGHHGFDIQDDNKLTPLIIQQAIDFIERCNRNQGVAR